jgi:transglutaminase-like putative cysteine protease
VEIEPGPSCREEDTDSWGNRIQRVWFQGETEYLEIRSQLEVETREPELRLNSGDVCLPVDYSTESVALTPFLEPLEDTATLQPFVQPLLVTAAGDGLAFLDRLNQTVHGFYHRGLRLDGPPRPPAQTLALGEGVCRDLAVLFMAVCRQVGLASRFVSGYQQGEGTRAVRYLHAWSEVYLPGKGWRGYDPTHGSVVGGDHVVVATAPDAAAVTPVEGGYSFRGETLDTTLETDIRITTR